MSSYFSLSPLSIFSWSRIYFATIHSFNTPYDDSLFAISKVSAIISSLVSIFLLLLFKVLQSNKRLGHTSRAIATLQSVDIVGIDSPRSILTICDGLIPVIVASLRMLIPFSSLTALKCSFTSSPHDCFRLLWTDIYILPRKVFSFVGTL